MVAAVRDVEPAAGVAGGAGRGGGSAGERGPVVAAGRAGAGRPDAGRGLPEALSGFVSAVDGAATPALTDPTNPAQEAAVPAEGDAEGAEVGR